MASSELLKQIQAGKKLKKAETNDRSGPAVDKPKTGGSGGLGVAGGLGGRSAGVAISDGAGPPQLGNLFAGGMPKLRSTGSNNLGAFVENLPCNECNHDIHQRNHQHLASHPQCPGEIHQWLMRNLHLHLQGRSPPSHQIARLRSLPLHRQHLLLDPVQLYHLELRAYLLVWLRTCLYAKLRAYLLARLPVHRLPQLDLHQYHRLLIDLLQASVWQVHQPYHLPDLLNLPVRRVHQPFLLVHHPLYPVAMIHLQRQKLRPCFHLE